MKFQNSIKSTDVKLGDSMDDSPKKFTADSFCLTEGKPIFAEVWL